MGCGGSLAGLALALLAGSVSAMAPEPVAGGTGAAASPPLAAARGPTLALATEAATAAMQTCRQRGFAVSASVVDSTGVQKVLLAADGVLPKAVGGSHSKAVTANTFGMSTADLAERIKTDATLAAQVAALSNALARAGGIPLRVGDEVIGAIGVSGSRSDELDAECAEAGLHRIQKRLK